MNKKWNTFLCDPMPSISWTIYERMLDLSANVGTIQLLLKSFIWNIDVDFPCKAIGSIYIKKYPSSLITIGKNCFFRSTYRSNLVGINRPCALSTYSKSAKIIIGEHCGMSGTIIGALEKIELGNNVLCGANTTITDFDWHSLSDDHRGQSIPADPIVIHDNVWLGMNSVVLKGVEIGENSVIGANSIVTKSIPANAIAAGNPAKIISRL